MAARRRGRPCRAGERATNRVEFHLTDAEMAAVRRLAAANGCGLADVVRLGLLTLAHDAGDDDVEVPVILAGRLSTGIMCRP